MTMPSLAWGVDYFPFTEGIRYQYQILPVHLGRETRYFSGTAVVNGQLTRGFVRSSRTNFTEFWSETPEGDKVWHGDDDPNRYFDPPIPYIVAPLFVGKSWELTSAMVIVATNDTIRLHWRFEVLGFGQVTVPAGTFEAVTIRQTVEELGGRRNKPETALVGPMGASLGGVPADISYADGVGRIQVVDGSFGDQLLSYGPTAVEPVTWSQIRALYGTGTGRGSQAKSFAPKPGNAAGRAYARAAR